MLDLESINARELLRRECGVDVSEIVPLANRLAVPVSWDAIDILTEHWESEPPHFSIVHAGWDLKRQRGDEASAEYCLWAIEHDGASHDEAELQWASFNREYLPTDILLIDALDDAAAFGATVPASEAAAIEKLRDIASQTSPSSIGRAARQLEIERAEHLATIEAKDPLQITDVDLQSLWMIDRLRIEMKITIARATKGTNAMSRDALPPSTPGPGGIPILAGQQAADELAAPIIDSYLASRTVPPALNAPRLPAAMADRSLFESVNAAISHLVIDDTKSADTANALAALSLVHPATFETVCARFNHDSDFMTTVHARKTALEAAVSRTATQAGMTGYRVDMRQQVENNNPDNVIFLLRSVGAEIRWNGWLERAEICTTADAFIRELHWQDWTYVDDTVVARLRTFAARTGTRFCPAKDFFWDTLLTLAHANPVDPAIDALAELQSEWDRAPRLDSWLTETCGVPHDAYHAAVARNIIGGMVRRIRKPGCKHDELAVLIGKQGTGKSTLISMLAPRPEWFSESVRLGDEAKELVLSLAGKCVVEISEMGTRTRDVNAVKAMASRTTDSGRTAYARSVSDRPRRNIFVSSTNDDTPLIDDTGNRRFLPVRVDREINLTWLKENIRQLLGEAATLEAAGDGFAIPRDVWQRAAALQESARFRPEYEIYLHEWFADTDMPVFVTAADLSEFVKAAAGRSINANHYGKTMRALGFINGKKRVDGKPATVWHRGDLQHATRYVPVNDRGRIVARLQMQIEVPEPGNPEHIPPLGSPPY